MLNLIVLFNFRTWNDFNFVEMASLIFQIFETPKVNERKIPKQRLCIVHKLT